jgi:hypothetical protein
MELSFTERAATAYSLNGIPTNARKKGWCPNLKLNHPELARIKLTQSPAALEEW